MDLEDIGNKIANLTLYDVKSLYRQAKNYALNVSEIEAKVDEATNDDPWGASSTLMQEIAQATQNFQDFNEIMPTIYRRFMEKEAREWRQIYKALQLLEYLIKHGSERVVDDARSHLATIKILRNFHYIDDKGKDQGINVRSRAKELSDMLSDVDRIRQERRKARSGRNKYTGGGNGEFVPGSGTGRYGGFGSDSVWASGGSSGGYNGGEASGGGADRRDSFEEYDAGDYEDSRSSVPKPSSSTVRGGRSQPPAPVKKEEPKVADLFSFDDDEEPAAVVPAASATVAASKTIDAFGDDFDDFQAAPAATLPPSKSTGTATGTAAPPGFDFLSSNPIQPTPSAGSSQAVVAASKPAQPTRLDSVTSQSTASTASHPATTGTSSGSFNFDDLWMASSGKSSANAGKQKMSMAEMAKNQSSNVVWGASSSTSTSTSTTSTAGGATAAAAKKPDLFDLL